MLEIGSPGLLPSSPGPGLLRGEKPVLCESLTLGDPRLQHSPSPLQWRIQCVTSSLGETEEVTRVTSGSNGVSREVA